MTHQKKERLEALIRAIESLTDDKQDKVINIMYGMTVAAGAGI